MSTKMPEEAGQPRGYCSGLHAEEPRCCFTRRRPLADAQLFCCKCAHKRRASPLTCLAVCFLVLSYNLLGGFLFLALEGNVTQEETSVAASKPNLSHSQSVSYELRSKTVEKLWTITEDLNILYKENWTKLAAKELMDFQKVLIKTIRGGAALEGRAVPADRDDYRWTFSTCFLYALTLITTIGHGNVTPKSPAGKMAAIAYACVGIPIIMLYLSTLGDALARSVRALYSRVRPPPLRLRLRPLASCGRAPYPDKYAPDTGQFFECDKEAYSDKKRTPFQAALNLDSFHGGYHWTCRDHTRVPIILSLLLIVLYIGIGTLVFHKTEKWSLIDGCYFSFSSLATIGIGELRPGRLAAAASPRAEDVAIGVCCIYILVGIVVIAMCFNLIQEDLGSALKKFTAICTSGPKARAVHSAERPCEERLGAES